MDDEKKETVAELKKTFNAVVTTERRLSPFDTRTAQQKKDFDRVFKRFERACKKGKQNLKLDSRSNILPHTVDLFRELGVTFSARDFNGRLSANWNFNWIDNP